MSDENGRNPVDEVSRRAFLRLGAIAGAGARMKERLCEVVSQTVSRGGRVIIPVEGDEVLGCVTCCPPGSPWRELAGEHEGEFRMLAVAPAARGRGAGAALEVPLVACPGHDYRRRMNARLAFLLAALIPITSWAENWPMLSGSSL